MIFDVFDKVTRISTKLKLNVGRIIYLSYLFTLASINPNPLEVISWAKSYFFFNRIRNQFFFCDALLSFTAKKDEFRNEKLSSLNEQIQPS